MWRVPTVLLTVLLAVLLVGLTGCTASRGGGAPGDPAVRTLVDQLISTRSVALREGDLARWRATVTEDGSTVGLRELEAFSSLRSLGVASLQVVEVVSVDSAQWPASARAVIDLGYAVPGVDRGMRVARRSVTVVRAPDGSATMTWLSPTDALEVFDIGPLNVSRSDEGIVATAVPRPLPGADRPGAAWMGRVSAARHRVAGVMGRLPAALVVVPITVEDFAGLVKRSSAEGAERIAAVTEGARPQGEAAPADRVVVNPTAMTTLSEEGQTVVLAHELTHVALRGVPPRDVPMWWTEGCAEWTAYHGVSVPENLRWTAAIDRHRTTPSWPQHLPMTGDFDSGSTEFGTAYVVSEIAVSLLAQSQGPDICARLADPGRVSAGGTSTQGRLQGLGTTEEAVVSTVRALLAMLATRP